MERRILFLLCCCLIVCVKAQNVSGTVLTKEDNLPLSGVKVSVENSVIWSLTDENGNFAIQLNEGETLVIKRLGFVDYKQTFQEIPAEKVIISLEPFSLRIKEVNLTAVKKNYSEIEIKEEAMRNIQAFSLNEVLEQLPGQKLQNLYLNEFKPIVFRSAIPNNVNDTGFGNKSFGTAVVVDGIPLSNNENMQSSKTGFAGVFGRSFLDFRSDAGGTNNGNVTNADYGADLRQIPVEDIESVEIVQGIPSAKYGDLTSGLINIRKKNGVTPLRLSASLRDGTQEYNINKGFRLSEKAGHINANVNYLSSNSDPRTKFNQYERVSGSFMWTWLSKNRNISNSVSLDYGQNLDNVNFEEEDVDRLRTIKNENTSYSISNRFHWKLEDSFFNNFNFNAHFSTSKQYSYKADWRNTGGEVVGMSLEEGVYLGNYSPPSYFAVNEVDGKPVSTFFSAELQKKYISKKDWRHNFSIGASFRSSDNKGKGRLGSPETSHQAFTNNEGEGGYAFRPYDFGENTDAEYQFSVFLDDNISKRFGPYLFNLNAGLRYDNQYGNSSFQPRINTYLIRNNFKLRGGFGLASKAPSLNQIYTGPRYHDFVLADVRLPGFYNMAVVQTFLDEADNQNLKPSKSIRSELGLDYKFNSGYVGITGFYNRLYNGFVAEQTPEKRDLAQLNIVTNGTEFPTYEIAGYEDYFYTKSFITNNAESDDMGLELMANFRKLPINNLNFDITASYVETKTRNKIDRFQPSKVAGLNEVFAVYPSSEQHFKTFNFSFAFNYHLPNSGLVVSLRTQHFILEDRETDYARIPYAYIDTSLNKVLLTEEQQNNENYLPHLKSLGVGEGFTDEKLEKVYHNLNLKISKDFLNGFRFSFYANNFLDLKQTYLKYENGIFKRITKPDLLQLSFGAKIEYEF